MKKFLGFLFLFLFLGIGNVYATVTTECINPLSYGNIYCIDTDVYNNTLRLYIHEDMFGDIELSTHNTTTADVSNPGFGIVAWHIVNNGATIESSLLMNISYGNQTFSYPILYTYPIPESIIINPVTDLANNTGSGAVTEASNILNGPIGYVLYFIIAIALLGIVVFAVKKWF